MYIKSIIQSYILYLCNIHKSYLFILIIWYFDMYSRTDNFKLSTSYLKSKFYQYPNSCENISYNSTISKFQKIDETTYLMFHVKSAIYILVLCGGVNTSANDHHCWNLKRKNQMNQAFQNLTLNCLQC